MMCIGGPSFLTAKKDNRFIVKGSSGNTTYCSFEGSFGNLGRQE